MFHHLGARLHARARRVATITCHRRALEYAIHMTGLALDQSMLAIKIKAGCQMIKWSDIICRHVRTRRWFVVAGMRRCTYQCNRE